MNWPFVSRARYEQALARSSRQLVEAEHRADTAKQTADGIAARWEAARREWQELSLASAHALIVAEAQRDANAEAASHWRQVAMKYTDTMIAIERQRAGLDLPDVGQMPSLSVGDADRLAAQKQQGRTIGLGEVDANDRDAAARARMEGT